MIAICIPKNFIEERTYTLEVLFDTFLGLEFTIDAQESYQETQIILENGNVLKIRDGFFNRFPDNYLVPGAIPKNISILKNSEFLREPDLPVIYGETKIEEVEEKDVRKIDCSIDIIASSYFMLSRWEEYVLKNRDAHDRFPGSASLAFKNKFLERPIVNEYLELLWNMLRALGLKQERKPRTFEIIPTHDIDIPLKWNKQYILLKELFGAIIRRRSPGAAISVVKDFFSVKKDIAKDPFNTYDRLMHLSEKLKCTSYFFFLTGGNSRRDHKHKVNTAFLQNLYQEINDRNHVSGFHPSYNTYNDLDYWQEGYQELAAANKYLEPCGRHHFLRFEAPHTLQIWEDSDMAWDSTLGYADQVGFRCGVCYEFPVFNFLTRKKLKLIEKPLMVMDATFLNNPEWFDEKYIINKTTKIAREVKKYNGQFVLLWHNSAFDGKWKNMSDCYEGIIESLYQLKFNEN